MAFVFKPEESNVRITQDGAAQAPQDRATRPPPQVRRVLTLTG